MTEEKKPVDTVTDVQLFASIYGLLGVVLLVVYRDYIDIPPRTLDEISVLLFLASIDAGSALLATIITKYYFTTLK